MPLDHGASIVFNNKFIQTSQEITLTITKNTGMFFQLKSMWKIHLTRIIYKTLIYLAQLFHHHFPRTQPLIPSLAKRRGIERGSHPPLFPREGEPGGEFRKNNYIENILS